MGREEWAVNGGMKKWVGQWDKRDELFRNGFREETGFPMTEKRQGSRALRVVVKYAVQAAKKNGRPAMGRAFGE